VIESAPLAIRFEMRAVVRISPELKNLNGNHNERPIPEKIIKEIRLSTRLISIKLPKA
jgi:hypothetical protein